MNIVSIAALCVIAVIFSKLCDKIGKEYSLVISLIASSMILLVMLSAARPAMDLAKNLIDMSGVDAGYADILFKGLGICYVTQLACDICRDNGEGSLAAVAELAGKTAMLIIALPLFDTLVDVIKKLLN